MFKTVCVSLLALWLASCGDSKKDIDGFKDVKFGMSLEQVVIMGGKDYTKSNNECATTSTQCTIKSDGRTLFGRPIKDLSVDIKNGTVINVIVTADFTPREFISLADKEFGTSKSYRYKSFVGNNVEVKFWPLGSTTSLSIKFQEKDLDGSRSAGIFGNIEENKTVRVAYQGKLSTAADFEEFSKTGIVKSKDY